MSTPSPDAPRPEVVLPEVINVPIKKLRYADYNPRKMPEEEMEKLKASLQAFGFVEPAVIRAEDFLVVGGHQRIAAYKALAGPKASVPCALVRGLSDERAKLLNVALNKISGEWDYHKLSELLQSLSDLPTDELLLSGFSDKAIADILKLAGEEPFTKDGDGDGDLDRELASVIGHFEFDVPDSARAENCRDALRANGMTGPSNASDAFATLCTKYLALTAKEES